MSEWVKCSEQMPPEDQKTIFRRTDKHSFRFTKNVFDKHSLLFYIDKIGVLEWIPYDEKTWKELNHG